MPNSGTISTAGIATGTIRSVDDRDRDLDAGDELLGQHGVPVGEAADHRGRQVGRVPHHLSAERRTALVRLQHHRQTRAGRPSRRAPAGHPAPGTRCAAAPPSPAWRGRPGPARSWQSACPTRGGRRGSREPTYGTSSISSTVWTEPPSPSPPCRAIDHGVGPVRAQPFEQRGVGVPLLDRRALTERSAADSRLTGPQRDVPFVREPTGRARQRCDRSPTPLSTKPTVHRGGRVDFMRNRCGQAMSGPGPAARNRPAG